MFSCLSIKVQSTQRLTQMSSPQPCHERRSFCPNALPNNANCLRHDHAEPSVHMQVLQDTVPTIIKSNHIKIEKGHLILIALSTTSSTVCLLRAVECKLQLRIRCLRHWCSCAGGRSGRTAIARRVVEVAKFRMIC